MRSSLPPDELVLNLRLHGVVERLRVARDLLPRVRELLPPQAQIIAGPVGGPAWSAYDEETLASAVQNLESKVARSAPGLVFVHAAAVAFRGRALLLPGRSGSGKSTLAAALLEAGATYLSDEYAPLLPDGRVIPYPRALSLRARCGVPAQRLPAGRMRSVAGPAPVAVGLVAALTYDPDAEGSLRPLRGGEVTLALVDNAVAARDRPAEVLAHCAATARNARGTSGVRGEAEASADHLLDLLRSG